MNYFKKSRMLGLLLVIFTMATAIVFVSCGNDDDEGDGVTHDKATITVYKNITLGACKNKTNGHFLKLKNGSTVKLSNIDKTKTKELVMLFHSTYEGPGHILSPAAFSSTSYKNEDDLYTLNQKGVSYWNQANMVSSLMTEPREPFSAEDFQALANSRDYKAFAIAFAKANRGKENLKHVSNNIYDPKVGTCYLVQFNGLVRSFILIKSVVNGKKGSITFDMIVESRVKNKDLELAKYIQPDIK
ncbi:hypothetical protein [Prevotella koreensis]